MNASQLLDIKNFQREYLKKYGQEVIVDFAAMMGLGRGGKIYVKVERPNNKIFDAVAAEEFIAELCSKHKISYNIFVSGKDFRGAGMESYLIALKDYTVFCFNKGYSDNASARFIKKHRTTIIHHRADIIKNLEKEKNVQTQRNLIETSGH